MPSQENTLTFPDCQLQQGKEPPPTLDAVVRVVREAVRQENERLLCEYAALKPLLCIKDVARTLSISVRTAETMLAAGELPRPLWVSGVRRWHPDAIDAFLRTLEGKNRQRTKR